MVTGRIPHRTAFGFLLVGMLFAVAAVAPAGAQGNGPPAGLPSSAPHEVWMLDQGTDLIHVLDESGDEVAVIDVTPDALADQGFAHVPPGDDTVPHMIDFDSEYRFAFVAATAGQATIIIDTGAKEVIEVLGTGAGSHMAAVTPDDTAAWVAAIGTAELVEIELDLDVPSFEIGEVLDVAALLAPIEEANPDWRPVDPDFDEEEFRYTSYSPVCHQYTLDSAEAWITLGPGWRDGGLFVLDLDSLEVEAAWNPAEVKSNCGIDISPDGEHAVASWSGRVQPGQDSAGEWYVLDTASKQLLLTESSQGLDAHGLRFTPDGKWLWAVNRNSDDGLIINARNFEVVRAIDDVAETPDILDFSPDGHLVYISQRGPEPVSGAPHAASGGQPGVAVVHAASGRTLRVYEPEAALGDAGQILNDIHGVGVRPLDP